MQTLATALKELPVWRQGWSLSHTCSGSKLHSRTQGLQCVSSWCKIPSSVNSVEQLVSPDLGVEEPRIVVDREKTVPALWGAHRDSHILA